MAQEKTLEWRLVRAKKNGRKVYFSLQKGSIADRKTIGLGYVTPVEAQKCLLAAQRDDERTAGGPMENRLVLLAASAREEGKGSTDVVAHLLRDDLDPWWEKVYGRTVKDSSRQSLREYWENVYWEDRKTEVSQNTIRTEQGFWKQILEILGGYSIRDLDEWKFEAYLQEKKNQGLSGRSLALHRATYKALLNYAHRKGHIKQVHAFFNIKGSTKRVKEKEETLNVEEIMALLRASDPMRRCMWGVGVGEGLRPSELTRIQWEDIDLDRHTLLVRGSKTDKSAALIPLTPFAEKEIKRYRAHLGEKNLSGLVFTDRRSGEDPIASYKKGLAAAVRKAGIDKHVTPYLLRHTFVTLCWVLGIPKDVCRAIGRWTSDRMIDEVYLLPPTAELVKRAKAFDLE